MRERRGAPPCGGDLDRFGVVRREPGSKFRVCVVRSRPGARQEHRYRSVAGEVLERSAQRRLHLPHDVNECREVSHIPRLDRGDAVLAVVEGRTRVAVARVQLGELCVLLIAAIADRGRERRA